MYSSVAAPGMSDNCISKAACDALARCLAAETAENIHVYSFNPYTIDSELTCRVLDLIGMKIEDWATDHKPTGKVKSGQDLGKLIADTIEGQRQVSGRVPVRIESPDGWPCFLSC